RCKIPDDADPAIEVIDVVVVARAASREIFHVAVSLVTLGRNAHFERVRERHVDRALNSYLIVISVGSLDEAFDTIAWLFRSQHDCAAGRVAAEQRPLRALQDLD